MLRWIPIAAWMACVIYSTIPAYWLMIHPFAGYWRKRRITPFLVLIPVWMLLWVAVAWMTASRREIVLYSSRWAWIPAAVLFAVGFWTYRQSSRQFSARLLGGFPELQPGTGEQRLVTTGIRSRVRHPIYLAHLCEMLAWAAGTGLLVCYALLPLALVTGAIMIRTEDQELERRFGEPFRAYRRQVPALLPRI